MKKKILNSSANQEVIGKWESGIPNFFNFMLAWNAHNSYLVLLVLMYFAFEVKILSLHASSWEILALENVDYKLKNFAF